MTRLIPEKATHEDRTFWYYKEEDGFWYSKLKGPLEKTWEKVEVIKFDKIRTIPEKEFTPDESPSKYHVKNLWKNRDYIDFYMAYDMFREGKPHCVGDSAIEHAWKKLTCAGARSGGKSKIQDLEEAKWSIQNAINMIKEMEEE